MIRAVFELPAVDDELNPRRPVGDQIARERLADMHHQARDLRVDDFGDLGLMVQSGDDVEGGRAFEPGDELAGGEAAILVVDRRCHVVDVERRRVAEDQELNDRRNDDDEAALLVAPHRDEFLGDQRTDAVPHGSLPYSSDLRDLRRVRPRKIVAISASAAPSERTIGHTVPARNRVCSEDTK